MAFRMRCPADRSQVIVQPHTPLRIREVSGTGPQRPAIPWTTHRARTRGACTNTFTFFRKSPSRRALARSHAAWCPPPAPPHTHLQRMASGVSAWKPTSVRRPDRRIKCRPQVIRSLTRWRNLRQDGEVGGHLAAVPWWTSTRYPHGGRYMPNE